MHIDVLSTCRTQKTMLPHSFSHHLHAEQGTPTCTPRLVLFDLSGSTGGAVLQPCTLNWLQ